MDQALVMRVLHALVRTSAGAVPASAYRGMDHALVVRVLHALVRTCGVNASAGARACGVP